MPKAPKTKRGKVMHPNSRQAAAVNRKMFREQKMERKQKDKGHKLEALGEKLKWFQDNLEEEKTVYTKEEALQLISKYLGRFDEEMEQIDIVNTLKGRSGHQHRARTDAIKMTSEAEKNEFKSQGIEIPDILNGKNLEDFRQWNGELRFLQKLKLRRIKADDTIKTDDTTKADNETTAEETSAVASKTTQESENSDQSDNTTHNQQDEDKTENKMDT